MITRRLLAAAFWIVFGIPFAFLFIALFVLALFPGTLISWVACGEAEQAWVICAPLMYLSDALRDWTEES